jgi:hypothetical protein
MLLLVIDPVVGLCCEELDVHIVILLQTIQHFVDPVSTNDLSHCLVGLSTEQSDIGHVVVSQLIDELQEIAA